MNRLSFRWPMALALLLVLAAAAPAAAQQSLTATVAVPALNVRSGPGTAYPVLAGVRQGDRLTLSARDAAGTWLQVQTPAGTAGWVFAAYVQPSADVSALPAATAPALPAASPTAAAGLTAGGQLIVFQVSSGGPIYLVHPDGSGLRHLTDGIDPALSPDGRTVAFTRWQSSATGSLGALWLIGVDGSGERQLAGDLHQPKSPAWSPDGSRIILNDQSGGTLSAVRSCVPLTGGRPAIPRDAYDIVIAGGQVCFSEPANPWWGLSLVDVASGSLQDLPRDIHSFSPTWNPAQGWQVVYHGDNGLVSLDLNRQATWALTADVSQRSPAFSPDGRRLATSYWQNDHWEVHVSNADGTGEARLTETPLQWQVDQQIQGLPAAPWNNAAPAWSPDGSQIAFVSDRTGPWELWVMNADGSNQRPLLPAGVMDGLGLKYYGVDERVITWR